MTTKANISSLTPFACKIFMPDLNCCPNFKSGYQNQLRKVIAVLQVFEEDFFVLKINILFHF